MIDDKHDQRMDKISKDADRVHDSALDFLTALKRLPSTTSRNSHINLVKFENLIRGYKNG